MKFICKNIFSLAIFVASGLAQPYIISTVGGTSRLLDGNQATTVPLRSPISVVADPSGGFYISDAFDNRLRYVSALGFISTVAGTGVAGIQGDRGKATAAQLNDPHTVVRDMNGNLYIADYGNYRVRRISPDGIINTIAGSGASRFSGDGPAMTIGFSPQSITVDNKGTTVYIADDSTYHILKMDIASGKVTAIAGTGFLADEISGDLGPGLSCRIGIVTGMTLDSSGNLYLADATDARVRKIDPSGIVSTVAGAGPFGTIRDGNPATSAVIRPVSVAFDASGSMLIADVNRDLIFKVSNGLIQTLAGINDPQGADVKGFSGDGGPPAMAALNQPQGLAISPPDGGILFADFGNSRVRKILAGKITTVAGTGNGDGGLASSAFFNLPFGLAVDGNGRIAVADSVSKELRLFTVGGKISSIGQLNGATPFGVAADTVSNFYVTDDEPAVLKISSAGSTTKIAGDPNDTGNLSGVAVDSAGNTYVADYNNHQIRKITPSGTSTIFAGNGKFFASGDNGLATAAGMDPFDVAVDTRQNVYVADRANNLIRKITPAGIISTIAGTGLPGYSGDGGLATSAMLSGPTGVAVDSAGNVYICDRDNGFLRRVTAGGLITTIAGTGTSNPASGDGGLATLAQLDPWRVAVDAAGNVYVSDATNDLIRMLTPKAVAAVSIKVFTGNNQTGTAGAALKTPLKVQVLDATGAGVPGVLVTFAISPSGAATISPSPSITLNDGTATANVTLGNTAGPVTITASAPGVTGAATFTLTVTTPVSANAPQISSGGVVSAGLSVPAVKTLSANAIATVYGVNFAPAGTARQLSTADLVNGKVPTLLAGVCVIVGGQRAPIFAVYPNQINFQVPALPPLNATVQVTTNCDGLNSQTSNAEPVAIQAASPEFFYFVTNADGHNPIAAINAVTGAYIGSAGLLPGGSFTPAKPGDVLTLFATGFGATNPSLGPGELPTAAASVTAPVTLTIGGVAIPSANIIYTGVVGGNAGLYQVNVIVPDNVPTGDQPVVITIGGVASPAKAYLTFAN